MDRCLAGRSRQEGRDSGSSTLRAQSLDCVRPEGKRRQAMVLALVWTGWLFSRGASRFLPSSFARAAEASLMSISIFPARSFTKTHTNARTVLQTHRARHATKKKSVCLVSCCVPVLPRSSIPTCSLGLPPPSPRVITAVQPKVQPAWQPSWQATAPGTTTHPHAPCLPASSSRPPPNPRDIILA